MRDTINISILIILAVHLQRTSEAEHSKCIPVCPVCVVRPQDSYSQFALRHLKELGPGNGTCLNGTKWVHHGKDYGMLNDACCCLMLPPAETVDCGPNTCSPECPPTPSIGPDEPIGHFWKRVGRLLRDAPTTGCCPEGMFRWVYTKEMTGAEADRCSCVVPNVIADPDVDWQDKPSPSSC